MSIKFKDIDEGSDTGSGVDGRRANLKSTKITGGEKDQKKKYGGSLKVIEGEGIPGKADRN